MVSRKKRILSCRFDVQNELFKSLFNLFGYCDQPLDNNDDNNNQIKRLISNEWISLSLSLERGCRISHKRGEGLGYHIAEGIVSERRSRLLYKRGDCIRERTF